MPSMIKEHREWRGRGHRHFGGPWTFLTPHTLLAFSPSFSQLTSLPIHKSRIPTHLYDLLFSLHQTPPLNSPEPQLPHRTISGALPLPEEDSWRPSRQSSLGFAPFKPP
ncbi:hypothetical protein KCU90_g233, partial [Aureobasidium melanogenum]